MPSDNNLKELEGKVIESFSIEEVYRHVEFLVELGERLTGSKEMEKAAKYVKEVLKAYGLEPRIDEFYVYTSFPGLSEFKIIEPEQLVVESFPNLHCYSTSPEGIEGELEYVGSGSEDKYKKKDAKGKIVLAELSYSPPRPEKAKIAEKHGAKALVIMNWGPSDKSIVGRGAIKWVWGNPTPESWKQIPKIPSINISRAAGERLKEMLNKKGVKAWLRVENVKSWVKAKQPVAEIVGSSEPNMFVLVGGHLDAWGKTATCNSSGNALMLELARCFVKYKEFLRRGIVFAFWDGHEIAEAAGSTWYVDNFWEKLRKGCIAYLNIDSPGLKGATRFIAYASPETWSFLKKIEEETGINIEKHIPLKTGDNSVLGIGIPYISTYATYTQEELEKTLNYASLGWWYHSDEDTLDKIDGELLEEHFKIYVKYIVGLCCSLIIPFEFVTVADHIAKELEELEKTSKGKVKLNMLFEKVKEFKEVAEELNAITAKIEEIYTNGKEEDKARVEEAAKLVNKCILKNSRILTSAFRSTVDPYDQEPYGLSILEKPIPRLYATIKEMVEASGGEKIRLLETKLTREKNKLMDALNDAIDFTWLTIDNLRLKYNLST